MNQLVRTCITAFLAYSAHYGVTKLYTNICIPSGVYGFFVGGVTTGSSVCTTILQFMTNSQTAFSTIIVTSLSRMIVDSALGFPETIVNKMTQATKKQTSEDTEYTEDTVDR